MSVKAADAVKIVLVGDSGVGKTSFLYSYKANLFPSDEEVPAILDSFVDLVVDEQGNEMAVEMWDVGGSNNYRVLRPMIYRDVHCVVMCFAIDDLHSLRSLRDDWVNELEGALGAEEWLKVPKLIVGMKSDFRLDGAPGLVSIDDVTRVFPQLLQQEDRFINYVECSAKTQEGEAAVFAEAVAPAQVFKGEDKGGRNAARLQFFLLLGGVVALVIIFVNWHVGL